MPLLLVLIGCGNPCQQLCDQMYDYAKECGNEPSKDEVQACRDSFADADDASLDTCRQANDPDYLREWWSCDDLADNWSNLSK